MSGIPSSLMEVTASVSLSRPTVTRAGAPNALSYCRPVESVTDVPMEFVPVSDWAGNDPSGLRRSRFVMRPVWVLTVMAPNRWDSVTCCPLAWVGWMLAEGPA